MIPLRKEMYSIEDQFLRLKCLMKNQLIDNSRSNDDLVAEATKKFDESMNLSRTNPRYK